MAAWYTNSHAEDRARVNNKPWQWALWMEDPYVIWTCHDI